MKKLIDTLSSHFYQYTHEIVIIPLVVAAVGTVLYIAVMARKKDKKEKIRDGAGAFFLLFSLMNIFQITLFMRLNLHYDDPFKKLFGGWVITANNYKYDFSAVLNIILFLPFTFFLSLMKKSNKPQTVWIMTAVSAVLTLLIETTQAVFHIGSFQLSDIVYNTLGGFLGAGAYWLICSLIKRNKT